MIGWWFLTFESDAMMQMNYYPVKIFGFIQVCNVSTFSPKSLFKLLSHTLNYCLGVFEWNSCFIVRSVSFCSHYFSVFLLSDWSMKTMKSSHLLIQINQTAGILAIHLPWKSEIISCWFEQNNTEHVLPNSDKIIVLTPTR